MQYLQIIMNYKYSDKDKKKEKNWILTLILSPDLLRGLCRIKIPMVFLELVSK